MEDQANIGMKMEEDSMPQYQLPQLQHLDGLLDEATISQAFDQQQERLRATLEDELNKRLPVLTDIGPMPGGGPRQDSTFWNLFRLRTSSGYPQSYDQHVIDTLLVKNNQLQQRVDTLHTTNQELQQENSLWKTRCNSSNIKLREERVKSAELETKTQDLRAMLIPVTETQLSDGEVVSKFTSLRSQILKLVKSTWRRDKFKPDLEFTNAQMKVFSPFMEGKVNMRYLDNCIRGFMFDALQAYILGKRSYALGVDLTCLEKQVGEFEDWMWRQLPTDRHTSIIDWRIATMNMTAGLHKDKYYQARFVERGIWDIFEVFYFRSDESAAEGKRMLEKICNEAVDLSLMMRNAKDEYLVESALGIVGMPISSCENFAEEEASQPARSEHPGSIAYYIHGVLAKLPNGNTQDKKVLEKAHVVVYR